jgi:hypothetical protein
VHLRPVVVAPDGNGGGSKLSDAVSEAWDESIEFLGDVAAVVVTGLVFSWWLPFVAVPGYLIGRRLTARRPAATTTSAT